MYTTREYELLRRKRLTLDTFIFLLLLNDKVSKRQVKSAEAE